MQKVNKRAFVSYKTPDSNQFQLISSNYYFTATSIDEIKDEKGFIIYPFDTNNDKIIFLPFRKDSFENKQSYFAQPNPETKKEDYFLLQKEYQNLFGSTELKKIIQSRILNSSVDFDLTVFKDEAEKHANAFAYYFNIEGVGSWAGISPELFLKSKESKLNTVSLAGTKRQDNTANNWTAKEHQEQEFVSDYIENIFNQHEVKVIEKIDKEVVKAGFVEHLKTSYTTSIPTNISSFINDLHPTPATCGVPKQLAFNQIANHEQHQRKYYSGFLGIWNTQNETELYVNLRCMELFNGFVQLYLGGGLTKDSDPELEWKETNNKAKTLLSILEKM